MYLSEHFQEEPLYNLAASTLSARLMLIFSVIKADTKEYPCSCPVRSRCSVSFSLSITEAFGCFSGRKLWQNISFSTLETLKWTENLTSSAQRGLDYKRGINKSNETKS